MPQEKPAKDENPHEYSPLPPDAPQVPLRLYSLQENHESETLGTVFSHFMFIMFMSIMAIILIFFMMLDSNFAVQGPELQPDSFSVLNFNVSNSQLAATWEMDLAFVSQDNGYEILFTGMEGTIFYKEDIALAMTSWQPFGLGRKGQKYVHLTFVTSGWEGDQPTVEKNVLKEIKEEQEKGMVHFSMRINTFVTYQKWGLLWRGSQPGVSLYCWDLMVKFVPETGAGRLFGGGQKECRPPRVSDQL
ncbi:hypothetical protein CRYUN_Cryun10bG0100900 [Craigia yunnanensis]